MEYSIRQAARLSGLSEHTLRFYDREGLLPNIGRTASGVRRFSEEDIEWLGIICCLKSTGMSIKQMRRFVELSMKGDCTLGARLDMLDEHKRNVEAQLADMQRHLNKVNCKIEYYRRKLDEYARTTDAGMNVGGR